eukprot:2932895-Lingulodinium_polyedra.AAC.1
MPPNLPASGRQRPWLRLRAPGRARGPPRAQGPPPAAAALPGGASLSPPVAHGETAAGLAAAPV